jgi:hypothetical protein
MNFFVEYDIEIGFNGEVQHVRLTEEDLLKDYQMYLNMSHHNVEPKTFEVFVEDRFKIHSMKNVKFNK